MSDSRQSLPPVPTPPAASAKPNSQQPPNNATNSVKKSFRWTIPAPFWVGCSLSIIWSFLVIGVLIKGGSLNAFLGLSLTTWALGLSAITAPLALIWMVTAWLQRSDDIRLATEPLRRLLLMVSGETGMSAMRINKFNQMLREQIDLLRTARDGSQESFTDLISRTDRHRDEIARFERNAMSQVSKMDDIVLSSTRHIEDLMEGKFTILRVLDGKLSEANEKLSFNINQIDTKLSKLAIDIEEHASRANSSLETALHTGKALADAARAQETSLQSAAERASDTLCSLAGDIDANVARFLDRTITARAEAERLTSALDGQSRVLDDLTTLLPSRVSEAESVLRGVADRLYATEKFAREQTITLSEKLNGNAESIDVLLDKLSGQVVEMDGTLKNRQSEMEDIANRLRNVGGNIDERTRETLGSYAVLSEDLRRNSESIAQRMAEALANNETMLARLQSTTVESRNQLKNMSSDAEDQGARITNLYQSARQAGEEVQSLSNTALQNIQLVIGALTSVRSAAEETSDTMSNKLRDALDRNEQIMLRINESARMTVQAIGMATDALERQEGELVGDAKAAETALRTTIIQLQEESRKATESLRLQNNDINAVIDTIQNRLTESNRTIADFSHNVRLPIDNAVDAITKRTAEGAEAIANTSNALDNRLQNLGQFHARITSMGEQVGRDTAAMLETLEKAQSRFALTQLERDSVVQASLVQLDKTSERLDDASKNADTRIASVIDGLRQGIASINERIDYLESEARDAGTNVSAVSTTLQQDAERTRLALRREIESLGNELTAAEERLSNTGTSLVKRLDIAKENIDSTANACIDSISRAITSAAADASRLGESTSDTRRRIEELTASLGQQTTQLAGISGQLETQLTEVTGSSGRALQSLLSLNEKMAITHETAANGARQATARLEETQVALQRHSSTLNDAAQNASIAIQKAGTSFSEQSGNLHNISQQTEQMFRSISNIVQSGAEQTQRLLQSLEEQNNRLVSSLNQTSGALESTGSRLQQLTEATHKGADQTSERIGTMVDDMAKRLAGGLSNLGSLASSTDSSLKVLEAQLSQQINTIVKAADSLKSQHSELILANDNQRNQLLELFSRLGSAHTESSSVAERTIMRLGESLHEINRQISSLGERSNDALTRLREAGTGFAEQASALLQHAQQADNQVRAIVSSTGGLQIQAKNLSDSLRTESEKANESLNSLISRISSGSSELRDISSSSESSLTALSGTIGQQTSNLVGTLQHVMERQSALASALDAQRDIMGGLLSRLSLAQDEAAAVAERSAGRLTEGTQTIVRHIDAIDSKTSMALTTLRNAGASFSDEAEVILKNTRSVEEQAQSLISSTHNLHKQIRELTEELNSETGNTSKSLDDLLGRLNTAGLAMRDTGSLVQTTLGGLNGNMQEQSAIIYSTLNQLVERHSILAASHETQRAALESLLNRLVSGYDDVVSAGERGAARLSESAANLERQSSAIKNSAQATVADMRTFTAEISEKTMAFSDQTRAIGQESRGLLAVTTALGEEVRRTREAIQDESGQISSSMENAMARINISGQSLRELNRHVLSNLDDSAGTFAERATRIGENLKERINELDAAAVKASQSVASAADAVLRQGQALESLSRKTIEETGSLAVTSQAATESLSAMRAGILQADRAGEDAIIRLHNRLDEVRDVIKRDLGDAVIIAKEAIAGVEEASASLVNQGGVLKDAVCESKASILELEENLVRVTKSLPDLVADGVTTLVTAHDDVIETGKRIEKSFLDVGDRFIGVNTALTTALDEDLRLLNNVADSTNVNLTRLGNTLLEQVAAMHTASGSLGKAQTELSAKASASVEKLASASERLGAARDHAQGVADRLTRDLDGLVMRSEQASQRLSNAGNAAAANVEALTQASSKAEAQMLAASQGFRDQLERVRSGVQGQIDDLVRGLMQITAQLERTSTTLRSTAAGSLTDIATISATFDRTSNEAVHQLTDKTARMRVVTEDVGRLIGGFGDQIDSLLKRLSVAGDNINKHEHDLVAQLEVALKDLADVTQRLDINRVMTSDISDSALSKLAELADGFEKQVKRIRDESSSITGIVRDVSNICTSQADSANRSVVETQSQVLHLNKSIEEMQQRTDRMRVALKLQGEDVLATLGQILNQLGTINDGFGNTLNAPTISTRIGQA